MLYSIMTMHLRIPPCTNQRRVSAIVGKSGERVEERGRVEGSGVEWGRVGGSGEESGKEWG